MSAAARSMFQQPTSPFHIVDRYNGSMRMHAARSEIDSCNVYIICMIAIFYIFFGNILNKSWNKSLISVQAESI